MRLRVQISILTICTSISCVKHSAIPETYSNFPPNIEKILAGKCAISGCHNPVSKDAASGLSLKDYESLFEGNTGGPVVIPYRPDLSLLCLYTNTSPEFGQALQPTMPLGKEVLSREDFLSIYYWILDGAPDKKGQTHFGNDPVRSKYYVTSMLCDNVYILDAETKLPMGCVDVGITARKDFPACVQVSPDKSTWAVSFLSLGQLHVYDAANDRFLFAVSLGEGSWQSFVFTPDGKYAICVDNSRTGQLVCVDLDAHEIVSKISHPSLVYPRSVVISDDGKDLFIGTEIGNYITCLGIVNGQLAFRQNINLDSQPVNSDPGPDPGLLCEANGTIFIGCSGTQKILSLDMATKQVMSSHDIGAPPTFMTWLESKKTLFVSCMNDTLSFAGHSGSLKVINNQAGTLQTINTGFQPTGLAIDKKRNCLLVAHGNISKDGHSSHHKSPCGDNNGYVTFVDLDTYQLIPSLKYELSAYPYFASHRD
jgi:hypothetical protein